LFPIITMSLLKSLLSIKYLLKVCFFQNAFLIALFSNMYWKSKLPSHVAATYLLNRKKQSFSGQTNESTCWIKLVSFLISCWPITRVCVSIYIYIYIYIMDLVLHFFLLLYNRIYTISLKLISFTRHVF